MNKSYDAKAKPHDRQSSACSGRGELTVAFESSENLDISWTQTVGK